LDQRVKGLESTNEELVVGNQDLMGQVETFEQSVNVLEDRVHQLTEQCISVSQGKVHLYFILR
jgi:hypothetical protein